MSSFTRPLLYYSISGEEKKRIYQSYRYFIIDKHKGPFLLIPRDFVFDGASIPRFLWPIFGNPWSGKYDQIAGLHDLGYLNLGWFVIGTAYIDEENIQSYLIDYPHTKYPISKIYRYDNVFVVKFRRKALDKMFKEGAQVLHTKKTEASIMYSALRVFGSFAWNKHKRYWKKKEQKPLWILNNKIPSEQWTII